MSKFWRLGFFWGWSGSILQFRQNIIKVGSKSWLLTCSSNITLSLPSYTGSALKREPIFCMAILVCCIFAHMYQSHLSGCPILRLKLYFCYQLFSICVNCTVQKLKSVHNSKTLLLCLHKESIQRSYKLCFLVLSFYNPKLGCSAPASALSF